MTAEKNHLSQNDINSTRLLTRLELAHKGHNENFPIAMDAASQAKLLSTLPYLGEIPEGGTIADLGSGTGKVAELAALALSDDRVTVIGVDASHEMLELAAKQRTLAKLKYGNILENSLFKENSLDGIISSTTGHEVESFEGMGKMSQVIQNAYSWLKPDSRIAIRDFAKPTRKEDVYMKIFEKGGVDDIEKATIDGVIDYSKLSKRALFTVFHSEFEKLGRSFTYEIVHMNNQEYIKLAPEWAHEFYLRKDYTENWSQEIQEKYTYWTQEKAAAELKDAGFEDVHIYPDQNEYIVKNRLDQKIALFELNTENQLQQIEIPATHMVMTGKKPPVVVSDQGINEVSEEKCVNFEELASTIHFDKNNWNLRIGEHSFKVTKGIEPVFGSKKIVYHLEGDPKRVIKTIQTESTPGRPEFNISAKFKAMYQAVEREDVLNVKNVPHLKITDVDPEGPPYRYFIQEDVPSGSPSAAELISNGSLTENDVAQIASYINSFEKERLYQLDTNPYNWYKITDENGNSQMTYVDGKVYKYEKNWEFRRIGLLQWLDSSFLSLDGVNTARIPRNIDYEELQNQWKSNDPRFTYWKKYLLTFLQP